MFSRLIGWVESLFGKTPVPSVPAHGEPSRGNDGELEMTADFGWDKSGGWDKKKRGGWSPHGDEGMR
jgi:hypothetical protein